MATGKFRTAAFLWFLFVNGAVPAFTQTAPKKIRVDLAAAMGGKVSQYVDSVIFIPLERTKEAQVRSIFQMEVTDGYFVILDKENSTVWVFTRAGDFHADVKVGQNVFQFRLNKMNQIEIDNYPETLVYNMEGALVKKMSIGGRPNTLLGVTKRELDDGHTVYYNTSLVVAKDSLIYQLLVYQGERITNYFLPYPKNYRLEPFDNVGPINFSANLHDADAGIYYMRNYDYTVYRLTPDALVPVYQFVFPVQNSLPGDFFTDTSYNGKRMSFFIKDESGLVISRLYRFYKKGGQLFFSDGKYSYIFDMGTQDLVCVNKIVSDPSSYNLPLTDTEADKWKKSVYLNFDGSYFYFSCSPEVMYSQRDQTGGKKNRYPPALEKFFGNGRNRTEGNPVLVQVKFKKDLR
ncbi:MAG TPA: 6-bladed beta-propeller [Puia sp.]|nr:6-bladed beta-propeller [Puia sp.]